MNKDRNNPLIVMQLCSLLLLTILIAASAQAQKPTASATNDGRSNATRALVLMPRMSFSLMPARFRLMAATNSRANAGSNPNANLSPMAAGPNLQVLGGGTLGRLTKWTGFSSSNSFIGDTTIFEDKFGNVGIGTDSPTSKLTVAGTIQATMGGLFGDPNFSLVRIAVGNGSANGIEASGATQNTGTFAGAGVVASGGAGLNGTRGGVGVGGNGGVGTDANGGAGVTALGGNAANPGHFGGAGIFARGGTGVNGAADGLAGDFFGDVHVSGNLSKGGGSFKIDHPLDPENKYLYHSFVESPDMMNIYNGNVTTDGNGDAIITLPDWFESLNKDFRYQLTVIGTFAQAIVGSEMKDNHFAIKTSAPNVRVSWQVTGIRQDAFAKAHRISVEEDKPEKERGYFLHPELFNQPEEKSIEWARQPQLMQGLKDQRELIKRDSQKGKRPNQ